MNERIKLPVQEWLGYDPEKGDIHGYTFDQMREFAELIVNECCQKLENDGMVEAAIELKWHFGMDPVEKEITK